MSTFMRTIDLIQKQMKKSLLILAIAGALPVMAQQNSMLPHHMNYAVKASPALTGFEAVTASDRAQTSAIKPFEGPRVLQRNMTLTEEIIGQSTYDLQTNGCNQNRLISIDGNTAATWTHSMQTPPASPDRGTGYAWNDGSGWSSYAERIESIRTGWSSLFKTAGGREAVINHGTSASFNFIYRDAGATTWTETTLPTVHEGVGLLWPRAVSGGADGNSIHVIGITTPAGNGGVETLGQNGALLYWRSQDQGATWDIQDYQSSDWDMTQFLSFGGDSYTIIADGDKVAIGSFNDLGDSFVMRSDDNGTTWTKTILVDFPVDLYVMDTGIDEDMDGIADTLTSSDNSGALLFDNNGMLHAAFGNMRYMDADLGDANFSFFPGTSGLMYWNESMGAANATMVADIEDADGDDEFIFGSDFAGYNGKGLTSMPGFSRDEFGNIYLVYANLMDNLLDPAGVYNYRHLHMMASNDGGTSWMTPVDITPEDVEEETDLIECIFPSVHPTTVNNSVILTYSRDYDAGTVVQGDETIDSDNYIIYLEVTTDEVLGLNKPAVASPFSVYPNPSEAGVVFVDGVDANYQYIITDMLGKVTAQGRMIAGLNNISTAGLENGMYLLNFTNGVNTYVEKFMVK